MNTVPIWRTGEAAYSDSAFQIQIALLIRTDGRSLTLIVNVETDRGKSVGGVNSSCN